MFNCGAVDIILWMGVLCLMTWCVAISDRLLCFPAQLGSTTDGTTTLQHTGHITTTLQHTGHITTTLQHTGHITTTLQHTGHINTHYMIYHPFDLHFK
jgi:hypothetical protein